MNFNFIKNIIINIYILNCSILLGQTNEIGVFLGGSLFHGDVGYNNAESAILSTQPTLGLQLKRNLNYHFGVSINIHRGTLYASDANASDVFKTERNLHFKSKITEFSLISEFNLRPYMSRYSEYNISPFLFFGISSFYFNPKAQSNDGNWHALRPLGTEGQGSDYYPQRELYDLNGIAIPFGFGYKINVYDYLTLNFNISWRITFTDYIDDVSKTYVDPSILSELGAELSDQSDNRFPEGFQRGDPNQNDKYGFIGLTILYSIKDRQNTCENISN